MSIVSTLPALPGNMPYSNYFLYHVNGTDTYRIDNFDYIYSDTLDSNGAVRFHRCECFDYDAESDAWIYDDSFLVYTETRFSPNHNILLASTVDIYNSDGSLYCSATKQSYFTSTISLISSSITSSTLTSALNDTKILMPILLVALIAFIAFRKAWNFLKGAVRGA